MTRRKPKSPGIKLKSLYLWHRYIGLASALFVLILSVTGLFLNHTEELQLDSRHTANPALLSWYGIDLPDDMESYAHKDIRVTRIGSRLYWQHLEIANEVEDLTGLAEVDRMLLIGLDDRLMLMTFSGELVEELDSTTGIPDNLLRLGMAPDGQPVVQAGEDIQVLDINTLQFRPASYPHIDWSATSEVPDKLMEQLRQRYLGTGLPVERVILDLHSGRILGPWGVYIMDAAAVIFIVLAFSGMWLWLRRIAATRAHQKSRARKGKSAP